MKLLLVFVGLLIFSAVTVLLLTPRMPPASGQFVEVEGARVHYVQRGSGPDLVLLHGASGNLQDWTFGPLGKLTERYRVTVFDRPGLGHSHDIKGGTELRVQARHLIAAARILGLKKPRVLGHSFGGSVALAWGLEAPEDTAGLVLISAPSHVWPGGLAWTYTLASTPVLGWIAARVLPLFAGRQLVEGTLKSVFAPQPVPDGYGAHIQSQLALQPSAILSNARQVSALKENLRAMEREYAVLPMPLEILHGTADVTVSAQIHAEQLVLDAPNAELTLVTGVGHMPQHVAWDEIDTALERLEGKITHMDPK